MAQDFLVTEMLKGLPVETICENTKLLNKSGTGVSVKTRSICGDGIFGKIKRLCSCRIHVGAERGDEFSPGCKLAAKALRVAENKNGEQDARISQKQDVVFGKLGREDRLRRGETGDC